MMMKRSNKNRSVPSAEQIKTEILREKYSHKYKQAMKSTIYALIVVAAVAVLIATLVLPVLQISGTSMEPTLNDEEIVVLLKTTDMKRGDLCCFYYQNKLLIKRVVGLPGDHVNIDETGNVFINGEPLDESAYITEPSRGECDITFPCHVTDNHYFVLGDHRATSIDSRSSVIGLVSEEYIIGKIFFRIWPFEKISLIS